MKLDPATRYRSESASDISDDFSRYEDLFAENDMPRADNFLAWRYQDNPASQYSTVNFAVEKNGGSVGAVYATMGAVFRQGSGLVGGAQSLDTLTDTEHRRRGLFPFLTEANYRDAVQKGSQLVYGFPNENSCPTFAKHLQWDIYGPVDFLFRPLRTGYFAERILSKAKLSRFGRLLDLRLPARVPKSKGKIDAVHHFDTQHTSIWEHAAKDVKIAVDRSAQYLNWRIFERPDGKKYQVRDYTENGRKLGFVIWCVEKKHGGQVGYLMECLCDPVRPDVQNALLKTANAEMSRAGADLVLAWVPPHISGAGGFGRAGYYALPTSIRPTQLYWGMRRLGDGPVFKPTDWYISYLDSDTV